MGNLGSIISKQNKQILNQDKVEVVPHCAIGQFKEIILQWQKLYTGSTEGTIKPENQSTTDFKYSKNENITTLP